MQTKLQQTAPAPKAKRRGAGIRHSQAASRRAGGGEVAETARRIARMMGGQYDRRKSPNIEVEGWFVVRVVTRDTIAEAVSALRNCAQRAYIAVTSRSEIWHALEQTQGTDIGVMGPRGDFFKPARCRPRV